MLNQKIKTLRLEGGWVQGGEPFLPLHLTKYPWSKAVIPSDSQILKSQLISLLTPSTPFSAWASQGPDIGLRDLPKLLRTSQPWQTDQTDQTDQTEDGPRVAQNLSKTSQNSSRQRVPCTRSSQDSCRGDT